MIQNYIQVCFLFLARTLTDKALWRDPGCRLWPILHSLNFDPAKLSQAPFWNLMDISS